MAYRVFAAGIVAALVAGNLPAIAQESEGCEAPRFSDVGWTDISATTAMAGMILENLGYQPKIDILSVAVTYEALPRGDVDIFLGNWMPLQVPFKSRLSMRARSMSSRPTSKARSSVSPCRRPPMTPA